MTWKCLLGALAIAVSAEAAAQTPAPQRAPSAPAPAATSAPPAPIRAEGVAAIVNDEVISTFDVNQRVGLMLFLAGVRPTAEYLEQLRLPALRALVDENLQRQEAERLDVAVSDRDVDDTLSDFAAGRRTTPEALQRDLANFGVGMGTLRQQARSSIAWRRLLNGFYGQRIRISQTQVTETLNRLEADAGKPQYWISLIELRASTPTELEEAQRVAGSIIDALSRGADFARVAAQVSSAPSAAAGGDVGWLTKDQIRPANLSGVVDVLQPGQLSNPIALDGSVYIVAMRDKRAGVDLSSGMKVTLTQVSAATNQRAALTRARGQINGCPSVAAAAANLEVVELGEVEEAQLNDDMAERVKATAIGAASEIFESGGKLRTVVVCDRKSAAAEALPSRQQVERQLMDQELSMLSDRYLRNLYRDATVMTPMLNRQ